MHGAKGTAYAYDPLKVQRSSLTRATDISPTYSTSYWTPNIRKRYGER